MLPRSIYVSLSLVALPLVLGACVDKDAADPRTLPPAVRTAEVASSSSAYRTFTGTIGARVQSDLGFRVSGKVLQRLVDTGQPVKRGQVLLRLDPIDLELSEKAQREVVAAARARAKQAADDEVRYRTLVGSGAISASAYDRVKAAADSASADLSAAETQAAVALNAKRYAELVSDTDGVVMETLAEPGQVVAAGQVVAKVAHAGRREAVIQLPETLRPEIGSTGQASLFGRKTEPTSATLRQLSDAADRLTRTFEARYVLDEQLADAPLGATVSVQIQDSSATAGTLEVPLSALLDSGKGPGVWLVSGDPMTVKWSPVAIAKVDSERAYLSSGLKPGDRIIALGAHMLTEGDPVRLAVQDQSSSASGSEKP